MSLPEAMRETSPEMKPETDVVKPISHTFIPGRTFDLSLYQMLRHKKYQKTEIKTDPVLPQLLCIGNNFDYFSINESSIYVLNCYVLLDSDCYFCVNNILCLCIQN